MKAFAIVNHILINLPHWIKKRLLNTGNALIFNFLLVLEALSLRGNSLHFWACCLLLLYLIRNLRIIFASWGPVVIFKSIVIVIIFVIIVNLIFLFFFILLRSYNHSLPLKSQASPRGLLKCGRSLLWIRIKFLHPQLFNKFIRKSLHWLIDFSLNLVEIYFCALYPVLFLLLLSQVVINLLECLEYDEPSFSIKNASQAMRYVEKSFNCEYVLIIQTVYRLWIIWHRCHSIW